MKFETIIYQKNHSMVEIILNRPNRGNAINNKLAEELEISINEAEKDNEIKVIILFGNGKGFCAGADVSEINFNSVGEVEYFLRKTHVLFNKIEKIEKPTIAAINGYALGGGCELALCFDIRIASEKAIVGVPEIKMGFLPGAGGTQRLPRLIGVNNALEMLFTGEPFDAHGAYRLGLFNKVVAHESLMDEVRQLAEVLAKKSPQALKMAKKLVKNGMNMDLKSALEFEIQGVSYLSYEAISKQKA